MAAGDQPEQTMLGVPFQQYVDAQFAEIRRAVEVAVESSRKEGVPLREFITAILDEQRRGMVVAEQEREKAASALRLELSRSITEGNITLRELIKSQREYFEAILEEQRRGITVAEQEREKSARALAIELGRAIEEGDRNLREHIAQQIHQIREALLSADKLEVQRYETLDQKLGLITSSSAEAIAKAEEATEKRFEAVDNHVMQLAAEVAKALPREVAEATFAEYRRSLTEVSEKVGKIA